MKCKHRDCKYSMYIQGKERCCGYCLLTDKPRGTSADKCDKYIKGKRKKSSMPQLCFEDL